MSVFVLKLIAIVSMLIDHLTYVLRLSGHLPDSDLYTAGRSIGRAAFVIFCFLLVNGFFKTHNRRKYLARLILFAVISQIPFSLAFTAANYRGAGGSFFSFDALHALPLLLPLAVYYFVFSRERFDPSVLYLSAAFFFASSKCVLNGICLWDMNRLNVFYTLAAAMASMITLDRLVSKKCSWQRALLILSALAAELYFVQQHADYGLLGLSLVLILYLCRENRALQLLAAALWCLVEYRFNYPYLIGALSALIPLALYNGKLGPKVRTAFYFFYPAHLAIIGSIFTFLSRT